MLSSQISNDTDQEEIKDNSMNIKSLKKREKLNSTTCPICGNDDAGTHLHYGGRGCSSCRAFFRRAVQSNSFKVRMDIYRISHFVLQN